LKAWPLSGTLRLEQEIRLLLRHRLMILSAVAGLLLVATLAMCAFSAAALRADGSTASQLVRLAGVTVSALVFFSLRRNAGISLRRLRIVEVALLAVFAFSLAWRQHRVLLAVAVPGAFDGPRHMATYLLGVNATCLIGWMLAIVGYGVLIPNTWKRTAVAVALLTFIPCAIIVSDSWASKPVREARFTMLFMSAIGLVGAGVLASFGSFKISTLQHKALAARRLGPYRLKQRLGSGGMGTVYLAEHELLKRPCAVKLIRPERASDPQLLRRFEREVQATSRLTHFNTVEVFDYGLGDDGTFYFVMEYLPGMNLGELVARWGPQPPARVVHFLRQLCGALREAHGAGLVHRDIKPGNVIVGRYGGQHDVVKLLDFGLVGSLDAPAGGSQLTLAGQLLGTPEYMAPEQAGAAAFADVRSDLYSLGALAYFLLAGHPPFSGDSATDVLYAHRHFPVLPLSAHVANVPADLQAVVFRCLAKDPARRFADAASLESALSACSCAGRWGEQQGEAWWREHGGPATGPATADPGSTPNEYAEPTRVASVGIVRPLKAD
jgi:serine/threonine-protein kinase